MSGKLTPAVRGIVVGALERARGEGVRQVREEHLLAVLLADPGVPALLGLAAERGQAVLDDVRQARRRGGLSPVDADALSEFGVDVAALVVRVEAELGPGALEDSRRSRSRGRWGPSVSEQVDTVLACAARQAAARQAPEVAVEHVLLGLLGQRGLIADILARHGVTVASVLALLDARSGRDGTGR
jgi:ATP-dependent Clp protease ATP-binding subunit ClpA